MAVLLAASNTVCQAQALPATQGETLNGKPIVLAQAVRGHVTVLVASFSKQAGPACDDWIKTLRGDSALASSAVYEVAMLQQAPGFVRGIIKSAQRRQTPADFQEHFVILTQDEKLWRSWIGVTTDNDPWVVLLDPAGRVLWHGHGTSGSLETLLKAALR